ncbi:Myb-like DNA-binding protein myb-1 [Cladobotryum mycophilum]|uniref:Myb-like DNA-binding protein myb-1 n=1 Tax=Cladobotryum mycophilum TaxID=491253 RepID=A0ABR0SVN4_9HYPO
MSSQRRGPWSNQEDHELMRLVSDHGPLNWVRIAGCLGSRTPKQCRERYHQNLKPSLNHEPISAQEGLLIEQLVGEVGKRWAEIARRLDGRSDNAVKNWWNGSQNRRKRLDRRRGTHAAVYEERFPHSALPLGQSLPLFLVLVSPDLHLLVAISHPLLPPGMRWPCLRPPHPEIQTSDLTMLHRLGGIMCRWIDFRGRWSRQGRPLNSQASMTSSAMLQATLQGRLKTSCPRRPAPQYSHRRQISAISNNNHTHRLSNNYAHGQVIRG